MQWIWSSSWGLFTWDYLTGAWTWITSDRLSKSLLVHRSFLESYDNYHTMAGIKYKKNRKKQWQCIDSFYEWLDILNKVYHSHWTWFLVLSLFVESEACRVEEHQQVTSGRTFTLFFSMTVLTVQNENYYRFLGHTSLQHLTRWIETIIYQSMSKVSSISWRSITTFLDDRTHMLNS
jgi:hypothetical protein